MNAQDIGEFRALGGPVLALHVGKRLDVYLASEFKFLSREAWQKRIEKGYATVNYQPKRPSYKLRLGDQLSMYYPSAWEPEVDDTTPVLWQDDGLAVLAKPPGLPMHTVGLFFKRHFAGSLMKTLGDEWAAVHRLDRETSGVVLVARDSNVRSQLSQQFIDHEVQKKYLCIVSGVVKQKSWIVDKAIGDVKGSAIRIKKGVDEEGGQSAATKFECLETGSNCSLLMAQPITGRTNQIRVHAAYSGHHLIGDRLYYPDESVFLDYDVNGDRQEQFMQTGFSRVCLHAHEITFTNPVNSKTVSVSCPLWNDLVELWELLRLS